MPNNGSRRGATDMGLPLMILAFVVIGGFLYWLNTQAAAERQLRVVAEQEAAAAAAEEAESEMARISIEDVQMDATPYENREIRLDDVEVASLLGTQGFWLETPSGSPFLVSMSEELMAEGLTVATETEVTVIGTVHAMNDSTLTAWTEAGTIAEGDRVVAEFATHFIEATELRLPGGEGE